MNEIALIIVISLLIGMFMIFMAFIGFTRGIKKAIRKYEKKKEQFAVTQEDDSNVHIRPIVDGKIVDTPVEQVITNEELEKGEE